MPPSGRTGVVTFLNFLYAVPELHGKASGESASWEEEDNLLKDAAKVADFLYINKLLVSKKSNRFIHGTVCS